MDDRSDSGGKPANLAAELGTMADRIDNETIATFTFDVVFSAAERLLETLEVMIDAAAAERDLATQEREPTPQSGPT